MPNIANIVVKKSDGTTDVTYTAIAGAANEGSPALWQVTAGTGVRSARPSLTFRAKLNGTKVARRVDLQYVYPVVRTISGVDTVVGKVPVDFSVPVPEWATDAEVAEAIDQCLNLLSSTLIRSSVKAGVAPV